MANNPRVLAKHKEYHYSPETYGMRCNNCPSLSCRMIDGAKLHRWKYRCEARHKNMSLKEMYEITEEECPKHRKIRR